MELQLHGKRVLVTGSSSGIGAGIARVFAAEGATVLVHGRDAARADLVAAVRMIQAFVPGMRARGWGRVLQIASASATQTEPGLGEYQASKAALVNLTTSLARSLARTGVTVNTVSPGLVLTPASQAWMQHVAAAQGWVGDLAAIERRFTAEQLALPVARIGRPEDIGRVCAFLASPLNDFVTGANLRVDGGQCRSIN